MTRVPGAGPDAGGWLSPAGAVRLIGVALAVAVTDPPHWAAQTAAGRALALATVLAALWAAPAVVRRPAGVARHLAGRLARHRNTLFAAGCTAVAAAGHPAPWLMGVDCALLPAYLLALDSVAAGPVGVRQLRRARVPLAAAGAGAVTLVAALAPVGGAGAWGRIAAAVAVALAGLAAGAALWARGGRPPREAGADRTG